MKQETIKHLGNSFSASFQQKSTGLSLVITSSVAIYYFVNMWPMRPIALTSDALPAGYGNLVLSTVALFIAAQIVLQIVLVIGVGAAATATAHEQAATLKAKRNAYGVLTAGMLAVVGSVFLEELTPFCTANIAILSFTAAEIVKFASQLLYGRQLS